MILGLLNDQQSLSVNELTNMKNGIPVHKVGHPVFAENLAVAFDKNSFKDNTRLVKKVSEIIIDMHEDETLSTFSIKWFKEDRTKDPSI